MKLLSAIAIVLALLVMAEAQDSKPISIGTSYELKSEVYKTKREINVWLPPGYSKNEKRYPVVYLIDGGIEQDFHHISGLAQLGTIAKTLEAMIVVGIRTENRFLELTTPPTDKRYMPWKDISGGSAQFYKHVSEEVIPFAEKSFRTDGKNVLMGESLAGLFVMEVYLKHSDTFTGFVSVSPSLWWDDRALAKQSSELLSKHRSGERRLYVTMANEGGTMQSGLDMILAEIEKKQPKGLELKYVDRRKTHTHATIYHPSAADAFKWIFGIPEEKPGKMPWYLVEGGQPESS